MSFGIAARREITDPDGCAWTAGVRWLPRQPRWLGWGNRFRRKRKGQDDRDGLNPLDAADPSGCLDLDDFGIAIAVLAVGFLLWWFVIPVLVVVVDLLFLLLVGLIANLARVLFRRPWVVEAVSAEVTHRWPVVGWRAARRHVELVASGLEMGLVLPGHLDTRRAPD